MTEQATLTVWFIEGVEKGKSFGFDVKLASGKVNVSKTWDITKGHSDSEDSSGGTGAQSEQLSDSSVIPDKKLFGSEPYDSSKAMEKYLGGEISLEDLKEQLSQNESQVEKNPEVMTGKFSGGYEINGHVGLNNVYVQPDIKLSKNWLGIPNGIESYSIEINYELEASLTFKGKLEAELTVASFPIPIGATGFSVTLDAILFAQANGELSIKLEVRNNTKTEYKNGQTKKSSTKDSSLECDASIKLDFGPGAKIKLCFLGIGVADAKVKVAFRFKAEAGIKYSTTYDETDDDLIVVQQSSYNLNINCYFPIINLSVGSKDTLMGKINLSFNWELVGEKDAMKLPIYNTDKDEVFWQKVTHLPKDVERVTEPTAGYIGISAYSLSLTPGKSEKLTIKSLPERYSASDLSWKSNRQDVASVSSDGVVTANGEGHATITVSTPDGLYVGACVVNVSTGDATGGGMGSR